ncbi:phage integrase N-terminal SAM-like domain-containing protein [Bacillus cereus]|uniref:phage integrase N-terminal SAM-like domain-containing protein n=1 Tax=Bacillus cereus TaxID=1396 RepID=UPI00211341FA|nr:phage integrase N-terminal SAM-like domain-containing protein [Bacillus cereus]
MKLIESFVTYLMAEEKTKNTVYNYKLAIQEYASWFIDIFDKEPTALYSQNVKDYLQYLQLVKKEVQKL